MTIYYWQNFSKRKNSTKQPTSGTSLTVHLKDNCSILNPVFESATMPADVNYIYVADWGRYYFVTNVVYVSYNTKEFSCEVDVLASFKTQIGSTSARIAYAATNWNKDIIDPRMGVKSTKIKYKKSATLSSITQAGCYALTVFNNTGDTTSGLGVTYIMSGADILKIKQWLGDSTVYAAISTYFNGKAIDSILGCIWIPFNISANPGSAVTNVYIGDHNFVADTGQSITAYILPPVSSVSDTADVDIPYRYNDFRDTAPYSTIELFLPGIGFTNLNINDWIDSTKVHIEYTLDYATGDLIYYLVDASANYIQTLSCNVASVCPLGQMTVNSSGVISGIGSVIGGMAGLVGSSLMGNVVGAAASAGALIVGAANTVLSYNQRATSVKGSIGGRSSTEIQEAIITGFYMDTEDIDSASYIAAKGRPVNVTHAISNHSGFIICDDASVANVGTPIEKDRVNQYLNTGFFYE